MARSPTAATIGGNLGGLGKGKRAPTPTVGDSSLRFVRSHQASKTGIRNLQASKTGIRNLQASKTGIRNLQMLELSLAQPSERIADESSSTSDDAGSYQSSGHGAHSLKESREISSGSGCCPKVRPPHETH